MTCRQAEMAIITPAKCDAEVPAFHDVIITTLIDMLDLFAHAIFAFGCPAPPSPRIKPANNATIAVARPLFPS